MHFIYSFLPVLMVSLTMLAFQWIFGGIQPARTITIVPWLMAFALEALLFLPERRDGEDMFTARTRVWRSLGRDPLTWFALIATIILVLPFFNRALCPICDYDKILDLFLKSEYARMPDLTPDKTAPVFASLAAAPVKYMPSCLDPSEHLTCVMWFVPTFAVVLAAKHALTRHGKRRLMEMMAWSGAALAVLGFIQIATDAPGAWWVEEKPRGEFFSSFGYANMGASFFAMTLAISLAVWRTRVKETIDLRREIIRSGSAVRPPRTLWIRAHYALVPAVANFFACLFSGSRAAVIFAISISSIASVYVVAGVFVGRSRPSDRAKDVRRGVYYAFGVLAAVLGAMLFAPKGVGGASFLESLNRIGGRPSAYRDVAWRLVQKYPLWGTGGWGYSHLAVDEINTAIANAKDPKSAAAAKKMREAFTDTRWGNGSANIHNDYLQFLCEHGSIFTALLLAMTINLFWPLVYTWYKLAKKIRFEKRPDHLPAHPHALYVLPEGAFFTLLGVICVFIHALADCPLRSPANLSLLLVSIACIKGYLPREV